jgi:putative ABC transport system ATP-binding protein
MRFRGASKNNREKRVLKLLNLVGLEYKGSNKPSELSGGQQQRVAIARCLANDPQIIMADEPTGALDQTTGETIMALLKRLNREEGKTLIVVTHDMKIAKNSPRIIELVDGKIVAGG